jgi:hypothetical protein
MGFLWLFAGVRYLDWALQSSFEPDPCSSRSLWIPARIVNDDGGYAEAEHLSRRVRVFTTLDSGLLLRDLYAKLDAWSASSSQSNLA